jgi:hypothetical protein
MAPTLYPLVVPSVRIWFLYLNFVTQLIVSFNTIGVVVLLILLLGLSDRKFIFGGIKKAPARNGLGLW